jgi:hypothetical protein
VQEVAGLDVAVDDAVSVKVGEGLEQRAHVAAEVVRLHVEEVVFELVVLEVGQHERDVVAGLAAQHVHDAHHVVAAADFVERANLSAAAVSALASDPPRARTCLSVRSGSMPGFTFFSATSTLASPAATPRCTRLNVPAAAAP